MTTQYYSTQQALITTARTAMENAVSCGDFAEWQKQLSIVKVITKSLAATNSKRV